jgi:hypothetical protein
MVGLQILLPDCPLGNILCDPGHLEVECNRKNLVKFELIFHSESIELSISLGKNPVCKTCGEVKTLLIVKNMFLVKPDPFWIGSVS